MTSFISSPIDRVDGRRKVTGAARYAADYPIEKMAYAVPILSTIGKGRIKSIDREALLREPGVLEVLTRENCPRLSGTANDFGSWTKLGEARLPFDDDGIHYAGQVVGMVIAETLEQANAAALNAEVEYESAEPALGIEANTGSMYTPKGMGFSPVNYSRVSGAAAVAAYSIDQHYTTPTEHHNPMEPSATTAVWNGDDLTL